MSHWKRKNEKPNEEKPATPTTLCESLENDMTTCYKLMNGSKFYVCYTIPPAFYGENKKKMRNLMKLQLKFSGEMNDALHFFTEQLHDNQWTYKFYRVKFPCIDPHFDTIRTMTTHKEVKFAIQQPYFHIVSDEEAAFESFEEDRLTLNSFNFNYLKDLSSFSFFVWREFVHIMKQNKGKGSIEPGVHFNRQMCVIGLPEDVPMPTSIYCHDNTLLCMVCGSTLFIYTPTLSSIRIDLSYSDCVIGGISNNQIFFNVPNQYFCHYLDHKDYQSLLYSWGHGLIKGTEKTLTNADTSSGDSTSRSTQRRITDFGTESSSENSDSYQSEFLSKFTVIGIIGEGGFGNVFNVIHKIDLSEYAVKRIPVAPEKLEKCLGEVRTMSKLSKQHTGIARYHFTWIEKPPAGWQHQADVDLMEEILKFDTEGEKAKRGIMNPFNPNCVFIYIQMQLYKTSLAHWLQMNQSADVRTIERIKSWFTQIVEALHYIHRSGVLHRDLKPGNILLDDQDQLKIGDFGLATECRLKDDLEKSTARTRIGSWLYASPEQSSGFPVYSSKTDVFALGLILAELCIVMSEDDRGKIFDSYRDGKPPNGIFKDAETAKFVAWLACKESKDRPTCDEILAHSFFSIYV